MAKVGWRLMQDGVNLWARVVRKKYKVGDFHNRDWLTVKRHGSPIWRSVVTGLQDVVFPGHGWIIGDGSRVHFWADSWLTSQPLCTMTVGEL